MSSADCGAGQGCFDGLCLCNPGLINCLGECVDLANDPRNCGQCSRVCSAPAHGGAAAGCKAAEKKADEECRDRGALCRSEAGGIGNLACNRAEVACKAVARHAERECEEETSGGALCTAGVCAGEVAPDPLVVGPFEIDGRSATTTCNGQSEGYPSYSFAAGAGAKAFIPFQDYGNNDLYNASADPGAWTGTVAQAFPIAAGFDARSDSWSTTGIPTGLEYISQIEAVHNTTNYCIGIAAGDHSGLLTNTWDCAPGTPCPLTCIDNKINTAGYLEDGPAIYYDPGGVTLYAVASRFGGGSPLILYPMTPCHAGQPGEANCPISASHPDGVVVDSFFGHPTVTVNPCSHDAIVAYRDGNNHVKLQFFTPSGDTPPGLPPQPFDLHGPAWGNASACAPPSLGDPGFPLPRCGLGSTDCQDNVSAFGGNGCDDLAAKVQVDTKITAGGTCYAYVTYGFACGDPSFSDGQTHLKSVLDVVDITSESKPTVVTHYQSSDCITNADNDFSPTVSASYFTNGVGWFFYRQPFDSTGRTDPCDTEYVGETDANLALTGVSAPFAVSSAPFPTVRDHISGGHGGMGDYTGIVKGGLPGGALFPSWAQSIPTTGTPPSGFGDPCISCTVSGASGTYSVAIEGAEVMP